MTRPFYFCCLFLNFLFLTYYSARAQSNDTVFQVDIWYSTGQWDFKLEGMKSSEEFISFRKADSLFLVSKYYSVQKLASRDKSIHSDTTFSSSKKVITKGTMEELVINLNQDKNNTDEKNVKSIVGTITDKQINEVAKEFKIDWMFKEKYSSRADRKTLFKNIKSLKFFDDFYKMLNPTYRIDTAFTFANKVIGFVITTYALKDTIQYLGQPANLILQPFCKVLDANRKKMNCIINLDINNHLSEILPSDSVFKIVLETYLRKYYIKWSLDNEDMWE
ncbi:MAG: hypothetical protein ABIO56_16950 [Ferruginibacter sp.]